ncbi:beta-ketoacyl synthase N-terminal-like domain-containing protein [Bacillus swezeyi]|uniref:beta-ketoacyl synthase N-terminal-like domain-containing protein n=1 Tax=Bacillus swezeyi TaxID=1925020 RepID=UPI003F8C9B2B
MSNEKQWTESGLEVAVVGMAGKFPGAANIEEYWDNIANGKESVTSFTNQELKAAGIDEALLQQKNYVKAKPIVDQAFEFDSDFFGYTPREAALMDPQIRMMHECTWEALEHAGCDAERFEGLIGLYAGASSNLSWMGQHMSSLKKHEDAFQIMHLNDSSFASRIAYKLNLKGPSVSVQTACSTSLVAIHMACQGLLGGECDLALAGGVTLTLPHKTGYLYQEGMIYSPDGHCRPFDEKAQGTIFGEGVGVVALKRLKDAKADGDHIYAVIKGSATNNDGNNKAGYTAPGVDGQASVIETALEMAEIEPETIGYIEAHGTGTPVGDPIEIEALTRAFKTDKKGYCGLGSVKANIGHLDAAAGVAGFIKTVMMLHHQQLPPALHYERPNPRIHFEDTPFFVNAELNNWDSPQIPRRAGISAFGIGGANAHIILEESEARPEMPQQESDDVPELAVLSARTEQELMKSMQNLKHYLQQHPEAPLSAVARTLQTGRKQFKYRISFVCSNTKELIDQLASKSLEQNIAEAIPDLKQTVFVFPGENRDGLSGYLHLYRTEELFRKEADRCLSIAQTVLREDIRSFFEQCFADSGQFGTKHRLGLSHALMLIMEYAAAQFLQRNGIKPDKLIGRGFGEFTAACAAGILTFEDAVAAANKRGELISSAPRGKMLGVSLSEREAEPYLEHSLSLALVDEQYCIVSGLEEDVIQLKARLEKQDVTTELFNSDIAYQSGVLREAAHELSIFLSSMQLKAPKTPVISSITGEEITYEEASNAQYWAEHICKPIRFSGSITAWLQKENAACIDLRMNADACVFTSRQSAGITEKVNNAGKNRILEIYGALWRIGFDIDFNALNHHANIQRIALPTYPFSRTHFPIPDMKEEGQAKQAMSNRKEPVRAIPLSAFEKKINETVREHFGFQELDDQIPLFELGATSLDISQLAVKLTEEIEMKVETVQLYQFATVHSLAKHLYQKVKAKADQQVTVTEAASEQVSAAHQMSRQSDIAIIGMAGRFPGAATLDEFWDNLVSGKESISFFTDEELKSSGVDEQLLKHPGFVKAKGIIEDSDMFDADFFQYSSREAELMDPQFRLLHECAWEALEDGGCDPERFKGKIGVYTGTSPNLEWITRFAGHLDETEQFSSMLLNDREFFSTQLAYKLNLHGPSITMQTACSTSLVNIGAACQALQNGACDTALAGGVTVSTPQRSGYVYQDGMIQSPDGHCRPFDAEAGGTVFGDGAGIVLLKRYEDAVKEGCTIHAVIKGIGINNDGNRKVGFTAPSVEGQADVVKEAYKNAEIDPATVGYIEAHGTGTKMGDPIEIEALSQVFRSERELSIPIGSVKSNVGHLNSAAGIAGLFKTILSLKNKTIPPSLNYHTPNPNIPFSETPFYVNTKSVYWKETDQPRRAGVSSFGIGGTNAHIVIEEAKQTETQRVSRDHHLLVLSARTEAALEQASNNLKDFMRKHSYVPLEDIAYTLQIGRKQFSHRKAFVLSNPDQWVGKENAVSIEMNACQKKSSRTVAFMFSGQGSQYIGMLKGLYEAEPVFRKEADRCFDYVKNTHQIDLKTIVFQDVQGASPLTKTADVQPLLFIFEYALSRLLQNAGISPDYMIGHSIGEYTAACLSGVFSLETALELVLTRGRLMQEMESGSMMSVQLSEEQLLPMLDETLSLAAVNADHLCVVSGKQADVNRLAALLEEKNIAVRHLHTSHAFHSYMMEPVLAEFEEAVRQSELKPPQIPYVSNVTGIWIENEQVLQPSYWSEHLRGTVRFHDGLDHILQDENVILIEIGPGSTLSALAKRHKKRTESHDILNTVRHVQEPADDHAYFLKKLGQLWLMGCEINWERYYENEKRQLVKLPTYPFEKKRYWIDADANFEVIAKTDSPNKKKPMEEWFYLPSWERKPHSSSSIKPSEEIDQDRITLVFHDDTGFGGLLTEEMEQCGQKAVIVKKGLCFEKIDSRLYVINPASGRDYERLFASLVSSDLLPDRMIHLWGVSKETCAEQRQNFQKYNESGYYSLIFLAQAAAKQKRMNECKIFVVTSDIHEVTGEERICAEKSAVLGPCKVISQEYNYMKCWNIDIPPIPACITWVEEELAEQICFEIQHPEQDQIVSYRNRRRWVQNYRPIQLKKASGLPKMIRPKGVYLITGGLGGIGFILSKMLAKEGNVQLILTGRSALPPREQWDSWCREKGDDPAVMKIKKIKELEDLGAGVNVLQADAGNLQEMETVMEEILAQHGQLHGVFHAAGLPGSSSFRAIKDIPNEIGEGEDQFQSKVNGLTVLESLLARVEVDFCLLFSSISALLGGLGFSAYSAANIYMDAFAQRMNQKSKTPWICINWDAWNFWGQLDSTIGESISDLAIMPEEGADLFQYVLSDVRNRHILVSTGSLDQRIDQWTSLKMDQPAAEEKKSSAHTRPELQNPYVAPRNQTEKVICRIWQEFMGLEQVGIHDNFFDLGASSLDIVQVTNRLNKELGTNEAVVTLFTYPSVSALAEYIHPAEEEEKEEEMAFASKSGRKARIRNQRHKRLRGGDDIE